MVHWAEDSYATESTPVIGRWVVTPNLLHHRDGTAFVRKGWLASNWDLATVGVAIVAVAAMAGALTWHIALFALLGGHANQVHKWNHCAARACRSRCERCNACACCNRPGITRSIIAARRTATTA